jgi:hypothetical protein
MVYPQMVVPAPKPRNTLRIVLIVVGAVLAVCCLGGVAGGFFLFRTYSNNAGPARDATTAYVDDVRAGDYPGAYGMLCQKMRDTMSLDEYTRTQSAQLKIGTYKIVGVRVNTYNGHLSAVVTVQMTQEQTGAGFTQGFPLVKEDGQWRICQ